MQEVYYAIALPVLILGFATPNPNDGKAINYYSKLLSAFIVSCCAFKTHNLISRFGDWEDLQLPLPQSLIPNLQSL